MPSPELLASHALLPTRTYESYPCVEEVEAGTMARWSTMECSVAPEFARRSRARRRSSSGVDGDDVLLPEKTQKLVKTVREVKIDQKEVDGGLERDAAHRSSSNSPSVTARLGGCSWAAWWLSEGGAWGKRESGSRGSYSKNRRVK